MSTTPRLADLNALFSFRNSWIYTYIQSIAMRKTYELILLGLQLNSRRKGHQGDIGRTEISFCNTFWFSDSETFVCPRKFCDTYIHDSGIYCKAASSSIMNHHCLSAHGWCLPSTVQTGIHRHDSVLRLGCLGVWFYFVDNLVGWLELVDRRSNVSFGDIS